MESSDIEKEIEELSQQIEERRKLLSQERGLVTDEEIDKNLIYETVLESFGEKLPPQAPPVEEKIEKKDEAAEALPTKKATGHYLDNLPEEVIVQINELISQIPQKGLRRTVKEAKNLDPASLDAFHDALTDRLYEELKKIKAI